MILNKLQILTAEDLKIDEYEVPEWGGSVNLIQLTAKQRAQAVKLSKAVNEGKKTNDDLQAYLIRLSVVDTEKKTVFDEKDIPALVEKSGDVMDRLGEKILRFNKLIKDDQKLELNP